MKTVGIIIGRFQSAEISPEMSAFVNAIKNENDLTAVILGVAKVRGSKVNPFDFQTRKAMLSSLITDSLIFPFDDHPSDETWSKELDDLIRAKFPTSRIRIYGSKKGLIDHYFGEYECREVGPQHRPGANSDELKTKYRSSAEFRHGMLCAVNDVFPRVYPTVDIALFRNKRSAILLGFKSLDGKWRLLGGFTDPTDSSYEDAALRELREETAIATAANLAYEKSFRIDDWRYRDEEDKIISNLFSADYVSGDAKGSDDIAEVKWFELLELKGMMQDKATAPEHEPLFKYLLDKYLPAGK